MRRVYVFMILFFTSIDLIDFNQNLDAIHFHENDLVYGVIISLYCVHCRFISHCSQNIFSFSRGYMTPKKVKIMIILIKGYVHIKETNLIISKYHILKSALVAQLTKYHMG